MMTLKENIRNAVKAALDEDIGKGDITTESTIPKGTRVKAFMVAKEDCVVCGLVAAEEVFRQLDSSVSFRKLVNDGDSASKGTRIVEIEGEAGPILTGERTALNFVQRLSGIATKTRRMVDRLEGSRTSILDTRKTTPGLREIEKYAVRCGGGKNHRKGLYDEILIKDNHVDLVGMEAAVKSAKNTGKRVEVEVRDIGETQKSLDAGAEIIMLDNMSREDMEKAVKLIGDRATIEVSGGVDESMIPWLSRLGVDWISVGSLTHSVKSVDIGMYMEKA